jgi:hypothetical protein
MKFLSVFLLLVLFTAGCIPDTPAATETAPVEPPATEPPPEPTDTMAPTDTVEEPEPTEPPATELVETEPPPTEAVEATDEILPANGRRIEFQAEDGVALVGSYFPSAASLAPTVILMHQAGSDRSTWEEISMVAWLQNRGQGGGALFVPALGASLWPEMPSGVSFAVFTFDFREHGESGGAAESGSDFLVDAKAAFRQVQGLEGVDPERIVMIGASIGADAAVDACVSGCLGALSLSPGNYLDVSYAEVVTEMGLDGKPAWCLASEEDAFSANTCKSASGDTYRSIVYQQGGHGESLLVSGLDPAIGQVIQDFLLLAFDLSPQ